MYDFPRPRRVHETMSPMGSRTDLTALVWAEGDVVDVDEVAAEAGPRCVREWRLP